MSQRGQITLYIIIAALILLLFGLLSPREEPSPPTQPLNSDVRGYVQSCIDLVASRAVESISTHGGYFRLPERHILDVPIYHDDQMTAIPKSSDVENNLAAYLDSEIRFCLGDFRQFKGLSISQGDSTSKTILSDTSATFETKIPIIVTAGDTVTRTEGFTTSIQTPLLQLHDAAAAITMAEIKEEGICVSCILEIANQQGAQTEIIKLDNKQYLITLNTKEGPHDYRFATALR